MKTLSLFATGLLLTLAACKKCYVCEGTYVCVRCYKDRYSSKLQLGG